MVPPHSWTSATTPSTHSESASHVPFRLPAALCDMIQALARWRLAERVKIFVRINPPITPWARCALSQQTKSRTTARLRVINAHDMIATFGLAALLFTNADAVGISKQSPSFVGSSCQTSGLSTLESPWLLKKAGPCEERWSFLLR